MGSIPVLSAKSLEYETAKNSSSGGDRSEVRYFDKTSKGEKQALKYLNMLQAEREHPTNKQRIQCIVGGGVLSNRTIKVPKANLNPLILTITTIDQ